ncbi:hypothetical protein [Methylobacterium sp. Leaf469]|uniref:hypothetical protein n=1 Tax=Methylobacterium sp. Leaf469 TaxID=1736387 RepID=UPI000AACC2FB|nr:hypothetical protein [Methylobacterium sp. Leaf469]
MQQIDTGTLAEALDILKTNHGIYTLATKDGVEVAGLLLGQEQDVDNAMDLPYWHRLKAEIRKLLCTNDKRYAELRRRMTQTRNVAEKVGVPAIAAAMASHVGLEVALITPFVSLLLVLIGQIGIGAWCAGDSDQGQHRLTVTE